MDIVERLRNNADERFAVWQIVTTMNEAADEIERLREEVKAQKLALNHAGDAAFEMLRQDDEIERLREALDARPSNEELKLVEKHCDWNAFKHAFGAVMKHRRSALQQTQPSHAQMSDDKGQQ